MRNFKTLDHVVIDHDTGIITISAQQDELTSARLAMRREGSYLSISASYGPIEIAMRPRFAEVVRVLSKIQPVEGLQTTRQVGTGQAYLAMGLQADKGLVIRPTIVADATGHICFNLFLADDVRRTLFEWLEI